MQQHYDIIGDIHGCADELESLLQKMGYGDLDGVYRHPEGRKVIYLGDFIDRGPKIREVLQVTKAMCDAGTALAVLGNHEYNALAFHTKHRDTGEFLRPHSKSNVKQHSQTMAAFEGHDEEWQCYLEWFRSLPMYIDIEGLNIIHACWQQKYIDFYDQYPLLSEDFLHNSGSTSSREYGVIETLLKGKETEIGHGVTIADKEGHHRKEMRTKWWLSKEQLDNCESLYDVAMSVPESAHKVLSEIPFDYEERKGSFCGLPKGLTFVGHYWFKDQSPIISEKLACLDFSCVKGGHLAAYRWHGEELLNEENFVMVPAKEETVVFSK